MLADCVVDKVVSVAAAGVAVAGLVSVCVVFVGSVAVAVVLVL
jgi:hypothetical protein